MSKIISFGEFIAYGIKAGGNVVNGMPWSFQFEGRPVTHENNDLYLIADGDRTLRFKRGDTLFVEGDRLMISSPDNNASIEAEISEKANKAPRVTPADIEAEIASEHYFTADEGVIGERWRLAEDSDDVNDAGIPQPLHLLTFCILVLRNGFTVTGESACASPENFDAEIGRRVARKNAVDKLWLLLGFRLRDKLAAA